MNGNTAYALSKKYVEDTAAQFGALKGAPCKIKSIEKRNGQNLIIFEWQSDNGEIKNSVLTVNDGTPIIIWESNTAYEYGDIVIYQDCFYRCTYANHDSAFDATKWGEIGSADGNYDIIEFTSYLPSHFANDERKLFYSMEDWCFYLWDGTQWKKQQKIATYSDLGNVIIDEETLDIDEDGKLSIRIITESQLNDLFKNT